MITEIAIVTATTIAYQRHYKKKMHKEETKIVRKFKEIMLAAGTKNREETPQTFEIIFIKSTEYGYFCKVSLPTGLSFNNLESLKSVIEDNLKCMCELDKEKFHEYVDMKIITNPLNNLKYKLLETQPYELFLGYKYTGEPYKLNLNEDTSLLVGGIRGSGKSRLQFIALTTLLKNHDENEIEVYLMELLKKDLKKFKDMPQVKMFSDTLTDCKLMLERINRMLEKRAEKIDNMRTENIFEYNKIARVKMKYVYIFADEYSLFMEDNDDSDEVKKDKAVILDCIKKIAKLGRSVGVFFIAGLQRSTITEISSLVKSQMCRLSFSQLSELDSINIIGIKDAKGLKKQECILFTGSDYVRLKTPYIDNGIINKTLGLERKEDIQPKEENKTIKHYHWHLPKTEEWERVKNTLRDITVHQEDKFEQEVAVEEVKPTQHTKQKKRKNGVISLKDVIGNANTKG